MVIPRLNAFPRSGNSKWLLYKTGCAKWRTRWIKIVKFCFDATWAVAGIWRYFAEFHKIASVHADTLLEKVKCFGMRSATLPNALWRRTARRKFVVHCGEWSTCSWDNMTTRRNNMWIVPKKNSFLLDKAYLEKCALLPVTSHLGVILATDGIKLGTSQIPQLWWHTLLDTDAQHQITQLGNYAHNSTRVSFDQEYLQEVVFNTRRPETLQRPSAT